MDNTTVRKFEPVETEKADTGQKQSLRKPHYSDLDTLLKESVDSYKRFVRQMEDWQTLELAKLRKDSDRLNFIFERFTLREEEWGKWEEKGRRICESEEETFCDRRVIDREMERFLDLDVAELCISIRTLQIFSDNGITTVRDVVNHTKAELLELHGLGEVSIRGIFKKTCSVWDFI
jgi:hypothetical protein